MENSRASEVLVQCDTGSAFGSPSLLIRNVQNWQSTVETSCVYIATRQIGLLRWSIHHSARNRFVNALSAPMRISEVVSRHSRHTAPRLMVVIVPIRAPPASTRSTVAVAWSLVTIVMTVVT